MKKEPTTPPTDMFMILYWDLDEWKVLEMPVIRDWCEMIDYMPNVFDCETAMVINYIRKNGTWNFTRLIVKDIYERWTPDGSAVPLPTCLRNAEIEQEKQNEFDATREDYESHIQSERHW